MLQLLILEYCKFRIVLSRIPWSSHRLSLHSVSKCFKLLDFNTNSHILYYVEKWCVSYIGIVVENNPDSETLQQLTWHLLFATLIMLLNINNLIMVCFYCFCVHNNYCFWWFLKHGTKCKISTKFINKLFYNVQVEVNGYCLLRSITLLLCYIGCRPIVIDNYNLLTALYRTQSSSSNYSEFTISFIGQMTNQQNTKITYQKKNNQI